MVKIYTPSDASINIVDYSEANGSYTTGVKVAALLGISDFTTSTSPTKAEIGDIIRRCEDYIDEITNCSWRENKVENEFHDFQWTAALKLIWDDYRGKIRLHNEDIRKIIRIAIWDGSIYKDIASAVATVTLSDYTNATSITLTAGGLTWTLSAGTSNSTFNKTLGKRSTAQEICYLINEQPPVLTAPFTGATASKALQDTGTSKNISKFFYANLEEDETITIVSLLPGSDGSNCTIAVSGSGISKTDFTDKEEYDRNETWWDMKDTGDIFFRTEYPYHMKHSIKVTYSYGSTRVPAIIEDAATKLVACEIIAADDSYVLLGDDNTSGLDLKSKYDSYKADVDKILKLKKRVVYYLDSD
jgi:hypothetical protein